MLDTSTSAPSSDATGSPGPRPTPSRLQDSRCPSRPRAYAFSGKEEEEEEEEQGRNNTIAGKQNLFQNSLEISVHISKQLTLAAEESSEMSKVPAVLAASGVL